MPIVTVDLSQFSGETPGLEPDNGSVWFWPYRPYVEDSSLVSREVVKIKTVDGVATPFLPETPLTEAVWVQLRAVKGAGTPWLVQIPATDVNLFDLDHIDPETLDPTVPPSAAWIAALAAAQADIDAAQADADAAQTDATAALSGLGSKADTTALTAETTTRGTADQQRKVTRFGDLIAPLSTTQYPAANFTGGTTPTAVTVAPSLTGTVLSDFTVSASYHFTASPLLYATGYALFKGSPYTGGLSTAMVETTHSGTRAVIRVLPLATQLMQVFIDDKPLFATPPSVTAAVTYIDLNFATRDTRNIRIAMHGNALFGGIYAPTYETLTQPARRFRLGLYGDSYAGHQNDVTLDSPAYHMMLATGWDVYEMSEASTGYVNNGGGTQGRTPYGEATRLAYINTFDIDAMLVVGSINDNGSVGSVQAAVTAFLTATAALRPTMPVIVAGAEPVIAAGTSLPSTYAQVNDAVRTAALAAPNVTKFIDWFVEDWLTGNGRVGATAGNGNQDWYIGADGLHLNIPGSRYIGLRLVAALADAAFGK